MPRNLPASLSSLLASSDGLFSVAQDALLPIYRKYLSITHRELLVPQRNIQTLFSEIVEQAIGSHAYARTWANCPYNGWKGFFRWIWSGVPSGPAERTELHL
jgi:hypothetical protein